MKFNTMCDLLLTDAYKDKHIVIDEDRLESYRREILTPGSEAQEKLHKLVTNPQVGLKQLSPKHLLILLKELEDFFITPATLDEILQTIKVNVQDMFEDVTTAKAVRAAKKIFTFLKGQGVFVFAAPERQRDIDKILSDPEAGEWMDTGGNENVEDLTGGFGPEMNF